MQWRGLDHRLRSVEQMLYQNKPQVEPIKQIVFVKNASHSIVIPVMPKEMWISPEEEYYYYVQLLTVNGIEPTQQHLSFFGVSSESSQVLAEARTRELQQELQPPSPRRVSDRSANERQPTEAPQNLLIQESYTRPRTAFQTNSNSQPMQTEMNSPQYYEDDPQEQESSQEHEYKEEQLHLESQNQRQTQTNKREQEKEKILQAICNNNHQAECNDWKHGTKTNVIGGKRYMLIFHVGAPCGDWIASICLQGQSQGYDIKYGKQGKRRMCTPAESNLIKHYQLLLLTDNSE